MEIREEQHKTTLALGISMDRSGSMSATTADGVTKMQLAAVGAVSALELLEQGDEAAVWVVDTSAPEVMPLTGVEWGIPFDHVASVRSEGGGIYVGEALEAAAATMLTSQKARRISETRPGDHGTRLAACATARALGRVKIDG